MIVNQNGMFYQGVVPSGGLSNMAMPSTAFFPMIPSMINHQQMEPIRRQTPSPQQNAGPSTSSLASTHEPELLAINDASFCRVCGSPASKIRCGIIACEACKKFFLRNRDNLVGLQCITNRGDCVVGGSPAEIKAGKRSACSRCRLTKCFAVGMRIKGNVYTKPRQTSNKTKNRTPSEASKSDGSSMSPQNQATASMSDSSFASNDDLIDVVDITGHSNQSPSAASSDPMPQTQRVNSWHLHLENLFRQADAADAKQQEANREELAIAKPNSRRGIPTFVPVDIDRTTIQKTLKLTMQAVAELSIFQSLPWSVRRDIIRTDHSMWSLTMECFDLAVAGAFSFIKQLPGYDELPLADRCHLFAGSFIPLVVGQVSLPGNSGSPFFGQNEYNHELFFRCFPNFLQLESVINAAGAAMKAWNPTFMEFAILQALVFYQTDTLTQLSRPDVVKKINSKLHQALQYFYETNKELYLNYHHFMRVFRLLRQVETVYDVDMYEFANNRPDLIHKNRLFAEMFFLPADGREQRWYQMNMNALDAYKSKNSGQNDGRELGITNFQGYAQFDSP